MYRVLDKNTIENKIRPYSPQQKRGFSPRTPFSEIVNAIHSKLKTGVQWALLPVKSLFSSTILAWQSVYYHFRRFSKSGVGKACWESMNCIGFMVIALRKAKKRSNEFDVNKGHGKIALDTMFPKGFPNSTLVSDRLALYFNVETRDHQICLAHLLRNTMFFVEYLPKEM